MEGQSSKSRDKSPYKNVDDKTEQIIRDLIRKRGILKGRLTKFANYLDSMAKPLKTESRIDLKLRVDGAGVLFSEFNNIQSKLEDTVPDCDIDDQLDQRQQFEDTYYTIISKANSILGVSGQAADFSNVCSHKQMSVKLPVITLPTFDGLYEHWLEYRDTYLSLIHNATDISDIQKFHYLKSSLKGSAELVVHSLEISSENYPVAWELLLNRYDNTRLLVQSHVKALFSIQPLPKESSSLIRKLIDIVINNLRALKTLGEPTDYWDTLIMYIVTSKLDKTTERQWEEHKGLLLSNYDSKLTLKVDHLIKFLKSRADLLETLILSHSKDNPSTDFNKKTSTVFRSHNSTQCNVSTDNKNKPAVADRNLRRLCVVCKAKHPIYTCSQFIHMDLKSKRNVIKEHNLCENCLRSGHTPRTCLFGPCKRCNLKHNSLLHSSEPDHTTSFVAKPLTASVEASAVASTPPHLCSSEPSDNSRFVHVSNVYTNTHTYPQCTDIQPVLLSTALVEIRDNYNNYHPAIALLDSGSQSSFITHSFCKKINLTLIQSTKEIRGVGNFVSQSSYLCKIQVKSRISSYSMQLQCFVMSEITSTLPAVQVPITQFRVPHNVQLANTQFLAPQKIDLLIGADCFWDLLIDGKMRLPNGPFLQNTKLGWIISGPINNKNNSREYGHVQCNFASSIDDQLRRFWELEELTQSRNTHTDDELACEQNFTINTTRDNNGRFVVHIPLKQSAEILGESYSQAERRFLSLEKRLLRAPVSYKQLYVQFMREYIDLGHMTKVDTYSHPNYFMPHHGVFREHSTTTKLRVVFDASAASNSGISFNDIQLVGPPIQGDLIGILLRFRQYKYTARADCEKMYRQVLVHPSQRDLQLIIWRDDPSKQLELYRLNTVTYGTASAPFLSVRCLKQLAAECSDPDVKRVINNDFYVDDLLTSCEEKDKLLNICNGTADVLLSGCFPLRKWTFNFELDENSSLTSPVDNNSYNNHFRTLRDLNLGNQSQSKTLGLGWCNVADEFNFNTHLQNNNIITKRTILSTVSQIFDPLGLLSPSIIIGKVLLQRLWLLKLSWDDPLPTDIVRTWNQFLNSLSFLSTIRIPRYVFQCNATRSELHVFSDASQTAYGSCAYVRTVRDDQVMVRLLFSKCKVAPLKPVSIPRLELCGALLGTKLYERITGSLTRRFDDVIFWTDSTIVLGWLRMAPYALKTFVQNRVTEIHELTSKFTWRHVSGKDNPADLVSRGVSLEVLASSKLWWEGPMFLYDQNFNNDLNSQSGSNNDQIFINDLPELKSNTINSLFCKDNNKLNTIFPFSRFSKFNRMSHAVAYALRFAHNCRPQNKADQLTGSISVDEFRYAVMTLARMSQRESFSVEYNLLKSGKNVKSNRLLSLNLFLDENELIRVGGRIKNSVDFDFDKKHPMLVCSKHHFTRLLFVYEHNQSLHCGPQALLYRLREQWWPLSGRNLARKVTHQCVTCTRVRGKSLSPLMGNLPKERLSAGFPFIRAGVDYAGPVFVLSRKGRGAKLIKAYICLFICFTTRAVHLELVSDLSTDAYLLALKRFISRRGKPSEIFSDNASNFVGLNNEFAQFLSSCSKDIVDYAKDQNIKFTFIPPYSPHFGGLWEAGVKSCKYHLRRVVGDAHLTFEEMMTVLTQIEAVLNSRPLVPLSSNPSDFTPLSPGHFLIGRPLTAPVCDDDLQHVPVHRLNRYRRLEQLRQQFWTRWANEYISELQTRCKWKQNTAELKPDTLVLIKDVNLPPLKWQLGRIVRTIPGNDGIVRVADIRTSSGVIRRSFARICPLVDQEQDVVS